MQMMYETIYKALVEAGLEDAFIPQDFLNFFCLGNREVADTYDPTPSQGAASSNSPQVQILNAETTLLFFPPDNSVI